MKIGSEASEDIKAVGKLMSVVTSIIFLSEINKNMEDGETKRAVERVLSKARPGMTLWAGGNAYYRTSEARKQGEMAVITRQNVDKYVLGRGVDPMGRGARIEIKIEDKT